MCLEIGRRRVRNCDVWRMEGTWAIKGMVLGDFDVLVGATVDKILQKRKKFCFSNLARIETCNVTFLIVKWP